MRAIRRRGSICWRNCLPSLARSLCLSLSLSLSVCLLPPLLRSLARRPPQRRPGSVPRSTTSDEQPHPPAPRNLSSCRYGQITTTETLKNFVYNDPIAVEGTLPDTKGFRRLSADQDTGRKVRGQRSVIRRRRCIRSASCGLRTSPLGSPWRLAELTLNVHPWWLVLILRRSVAKEVGAELFDE